MGHGTRELKRGNPTPRLLPGPAAAGSAGARLESARGWNFGLWLLGGSAGVGVGGFLSLHKDEARRAGWRSSGEGRGVVRTEGRMYTPILYGTGSSFAGSPLRDRQVDRTLANGARDGGEASLPRTVTVTVTVSRSTP